MARKHLPLCSGTALSRTSDRHSTSESIQGSNYLYNIGYRASGQGPTTYIILGIEPAARVQLLI